MRFTVNGCKFNMKKMYYIPYKGNVRQIKIVNNKLWYRTSAVYRIDDKPKQHYHWNEFNEDIQLGFQNWVIEKTLLS